MLFIFRTYKTSTNIRPRNASNKIRLDSEEIFMIKAIVVRHYMKEV